MKKSSHIHLGLLATLALSLTSCGKKEMQRCVDDHQAVVDDSRCVSNQVGYHWYYGGGGGYTPGTYVSGGSYSPHSGYSGVTSSSVSRGGFGSSGGDGGGGGE